MLMPPYPVPCHRPGCDQPALYKIAARWSDGVTEELKTYSLCCAGCLPELFRRSQEKQAACGLAAGETLERPGVYRLERGRRDRQLDRATDLEAQLSTGGRS
jgi:hypothetical protein